MSILIILLLICSVCGFVIAKTKLDDKLPGLFWKPAFKISIIFLSVFLSIGVCINLKYKMDYISYQVLVNSIEELRTQEDGLKSTFITIKILEINEKVSKAYYLNSTILDIFIPDEFVHLKLIHNVNHQKELNEFKQKLDESNYQVTHL
jgi:hypothetical protein